MKFINKLLPAGNLILFAAPPKVKGMGTFPVRAHAIITDEVAAA